MKVWIMKYLVWIVSALLIILFTILFWKRKAIAENKFTKAKLEIFKAAADKDTERIKEVIDSLKNK